MTAYPPGPAAATPPAPTLPPPTAAEQEVVRRSLAQAARYGDLARQAVAALETDQAALLDLVQALLTGIATRDRVRARMSGSARSALAALRAERDALKAELERAHRQLHALQRQRQPTPPDRRHAQEVAACKASAQRAVQTLGDRLQVEVAAKQVLSEKVVVLTRQLEGQERLVAQLLSGTLPPAQVVDLRASLLDEGALIERLEARVPTLAGVAAG